MDPRDVRAYVDRTDEVVESVPLTGRHTQLRLIEPLLGLLGWDVTEPAVRAEYEICGRTIDYVFTVAGRPIALVDGRPCGTGLLPGEVETCGAIVARSPVLRGILTDGETSVLLSGVEDGFERKIVQRESLPERLDDLAPFTAAALRRETDLGTGVASSPQDFDTRPTTGIPKADISEGVTDAESEDRLAVESVDRAEGGSDSNRGATELEAHTPSSPGEGTTSADGQPAQATDSESEPASDPNAERSTGDRQYVVRFFGSRGSIGAVGHSERAQAMKHAVSFLFERGVEPELPWSPPRDEAIVLNDRPVQRDGSPMVDSIQLAGGRFLDASGSDEVVANRVRALAAEGGLRVMFQGEWSQPQ